MLLAVSVYLICGALYGEAFLSAYKDAGHLSDRPLWRLWLGSIVMWPLCIYGEIRGWLR